jgi:hypothetical protein
VTEREIAERIAALSDEARDELYRICELRKRRNKNGADVVVYEPVSEEVALALDKQDLVSLFGSRLAAANHDVYDYWKKHFSQALQPAH